ncbi:MAG TPA: VWA domain-containing protein, partial [Vicinamibacterales bacterium]|nr:VWA domain-containing protein [Vicinamibacterales bacterium]
DDYPLKDGRPLMGLTAEDFEVYEDGTLQKIETFEHVIVRAAGPQQERTEPGSQREMLQAAANPRNRVFIIFLDTPHVDVASAHAINEPLIRLIDRILGPDDLVGIMTPDMAASQIVLARKTQVIEDSLRQNWAWGRRFSIIKDDRENAYEACFNAGSGTEAVAREMIARKRERATLEALEDLVRYMRVVREERKAVLTVTEGWLLFRENRDLVRRRNDPVTGRPEPPPTLDPVGVGPNGKLTTRDPRNMSEGYLTTSECETERMRLASIDDRQFFLDLMNEANRANVSFYPIDPRGLPAWDNPMGPEAPPPVTVDQAMLKERIEVMRTLALNTDGMAVVNSNDLDRGLKRISDDLTSYYLLGYYSSNGKLDGRLRSLRVRVKQPGVEVRARKGYRAATAEEVAAARRAADAPVPESKATVTSAIDRLGRIRADARFVINLAPGPGGKVWVAGEVLPPAGGPDDFAQGATGTVEIVGASSSRATVTLKAGDRTFLTSLDVPGGAGAQLEVRARLTPTNAASSPVMDTMRVDADPASMQPLLFRRGVTTGNRIVPAADFRFSRTERLRLELAAGADLKAVSGRMLDRGGQALQVPVTVGERTDAASGQRWITADVVLAPLSPADYAIEVTVQGAQEQRVVTAIRVTR